MTKKEYWNLFKETGKIEYYLKYKKAKLCKAFCFLFASIVKKDIIIIEVDIYENKK